MTSARQRMVRARVATDAAPKQLLGPAWGVIETTCIMTALACGVFHDDTAEQPRLAQLGMGFQIRTGSVDLN